MSRTLIDVRGQIDIDDEAAGPVAVRFSVLEPPGLPRGGALAPLDCDVDNGPFHAFRSSAGNASDSIVKDTGAALWQRLEIHPAFDDAVSSSIAAAAGNAISPIHVQIDETAAQAETLPWETLHHPQRGFLALLQRVSVVRRASSPQVTRPLTLTLRGPIRFAVILGAQEISAIDEWRALADGLSRPGPDLQVRVFTCEQQIIEEITAAADPRVRVEWMPGDAQTLASGLDDWRPHLVHIFAHGSEEYEGYLEIAHRTAFESGRPPIYLDAGALANVTRGAWLITLDACATGRATRATNSLAHALVSNGVPAAIGMSERVDPTTSSSFTKALYHEVWRYLARQLGTGTVTIDWCEAMIGVRAAICAASGQGPTAAVAPKLKTWALPVLYMQSQTVTVQVLRDDSALSDAEADQLRVRIGMLKEQLAQLADFLPADILPQVRQRIEAEIADLEAKLGA